MTEAPNARIVLCTVPDRDRGRELAGALLEGRLAACVNLLPGLTSLYRWQGRIEEDSELLLLVKTDEQHVAAVIDLIEREHPYDCPEAIALPVSEGSSAYLQWVVRALDDVGAD